VNARIGCRKDKAFDMCRPDVVFGATAYKYVLPMKRNTEEAIMSSVLGMHNMA